MKFFENRFAVLFSIALLCFSFVQLGKPLSVTAVNNGVSIDQQGVITLGGTLTKNTVINTDFNGIHIGAYNPSFPLNFGVNSFSAIEGKAEGYSSFSAGTNGLASGDLSFTLGGRNAIASGVGSGNLGTDGESRGNYGIVFNDANFNDAESGAVFGFGSQNWTRQGFIAGGDNKAGTISGAGTKNEYMLNMLLGENIRTQGSYITAIGNRIQTTGNNITVFGSGYSAGSLIHNESNSFAIGVNSNTPTFIIHSASGAGTYSITELKGLLKLAKLPPSPVGLEKGVLWSENGTVHIVE